MDSFSERHKLQHCLPAVRGLACFKIDHLMLNGFPLFFSFFSSIIKQIPTSVNKGISSLSSDQTSFDCSTSFYENALKRSNYNFKIQYSTNYTGKPTPSGRTRRRHIIWFNPPYSKNVSTNVARNFLQLIDKHFSQSSPLHKIFNRNSIKVSYCCMGNMKNAISNHNITTNY